MVKNLSRNMHEFFRVNVFCTFRGGVFANFRPIWSHVNESENNSQKKKKINKTNLKYKTNIGLEIWWTGNFPSILELIRF